MEISRPSGNFSEEFGQNILRNASRRAPECWWSYLVDLELILSEGIELIREYFLIIALILLCEAVLKGLETFSIDDALLKQSLGVNFEDIGTILNLLIHQGLSKVRLILLVVTVSSIANDINKNVLLELLTILNCDLHTFVQNIRLISIDMDYWGISCFCHLGAIERRSALVGVGCETDLVVEDNVNDASGAVVHKVLEAK
jgi:hypothetical protein